MDLQTLAAAILVDVILTGIVVYAIQKKIEDRHARNMEEFRAKLQYEVFERQAKFPEVHAKRVKILEEYYRLFSEMIPILSDLVGDVMTSKTGGAVLNKEMFEERGNKVSEKLEQCRSYLQKNEIYLSRALFDELLAVSAKAFRSYRYVKTLYFEYEGNDKIPRQLLDSICNDLEVYPHNPDDVVEPSRVMYLITRAIYGQKSTLEGIYRSVVDIDQ
jgi:hypothetical protein